MVADAAAKPALAEQITRLYDLIAGYHATNLIEIGRELGIWEAMTARPGLTSVDLARQLGTDPFYADVLCRTAFALELLDRTVMGGRWRRTST